LNGSKFFSIVSPLNVPKNLTSTGPLNGSKNTPSSAPLNGGSKSTPIPHGISGKVCLNEGIPTKNSFEVLSQEADRVGDGSIVILSESSMNLGPPSVQQSTKSHMLSVIPFKQHEEKHVLFDVLVKVGFSFLDSKYEEVDAFKDAEVTFS
jgi:hypothetical protein